MERRSRRVENFGALLRVAQTAQPQVQSSLDEKRRLVADLCRMLGERAQQPSSPTPPAQTGSLSPRLSQTLDALLAGDSEKQIAQKLSISQHTVHVYVKTLYKGFGVSSRGELLARFIKKRKPALNLRGSANRPLNVG